MYTSNLLEISQNCKGICSCINCRHRLGNELMKCERCSMWYWGLCVAVLDGPALSGWIQRPHLTFVIQKAVIRHSRRTNRTRYKHPKILLFATWGFCQKQELILQEYVPFYLLFPFIIQQLFIGHFHLQLYTIRTSFITGWLPLVLINTCRFKAGPQRTTTVNWKNVGLNWYKDVQFVVPETLSGCSILDLHSE